MLIGLDAVDDFLSADGDVFFRRLGPVGSLRKDDVDVVVGNPGQVQFIDDVDEELVGMIPRACNIGDDQADFITGLYLFGQGALPMGWRMQSIVASFTSTAGTCFPSMTSEICSSGSLTVCVVSPILKVNSFNAIAYHHFFF